MHKIKNTKHIFTINKHKTFLSKLQELRKWIYVLKLFIITIVFTILSFMER